MLSKSKFTITVTDPKSGQAVSWQSENKESLINQARIEVKAGASVEIKTDGGVLVWKG